MALLLGIDQGTSGTTAVAYDERLKPLGRAHRDLRPRLPGPGLVEHDGTLLLESIVETSAEALRAARNAHADAVGLANQGETTLAWDAGTGIPLSPAIAWLDERTQPLLDEFRQDGRAALVERLSRLPLDTYFSASKMTWLLQQDEVASARANGRLRLGTTDAFFRERLCGRAATDAATASRTQLLDLERVAWSAELCEAFSVPVEALPPIEPTTGSLGYLQSGPLTGALVDQQAALAGHACFALGEAKCTFGTGCFLLTNAGELLPSGSSGLLPTIAWTVDRTTTYALDGGVLTAGSALDWLVAIGLLRSPQEADAVAGSVPDAAGVMFVPALSGLGAPWWRREARASFTGISAVTDTGHLVRAVLEGIALRVRDIVEAGSAAGVPPLAVLRVDGGLSSSDLLMQTQADVLGVPVERARDRESTARGAAALAGLGAGILAEPEELVTLLPEPERFEPRWADERRAETYARWRLLLEREERA